MALPALRRFLVKIQVGDGCWEWQATTSRTGYGQFWDGGRVTSPHRWSYEFFVAPIPAGLEIDHACRNRRCVRYDHLRVMTHAENLALAVDGAPEINRRKTHCPHGHEYSPENTIIGKHGSRFCRECQRASSARAKRRRV